jgi:hypothetical protein
VDLVLERVAENGDLVGRSGVLVPAGDIARVERLTISPLRTTLLVAGVTAGALFLVAALALALGTP